MFLPKKITSNFYCSISEIEKNSRLHREKKEFEYISIKKLLKTQFTFNIS